MILSVSRGAQNSSENFSDLNCLNLELKAFPEIVLLCCFFSSLFLFFTVLT